MRRDPMTEDLSTTTESQSVDEEPRTRDRGPWTVVPVARNTHAIFWPFTAATSVISASN